MNFLLLSFLFIISFAKNTDENCGKPDGSEGTCIRPNDFSPSGANEEQQIEDQLNTIRNQVASGVFNCSCVSGKCPKAQHMFKLIWLDALADSAQDYINAKSPYTHGVYNGGSYQSHSESADRKSSAYTHCSNTNCIANIQSGDSIGENIYRKYKWSSSNGVITRIIYDIDTLIGKATDRWDVDEALEYCPGDNDYNHFTQDVWDDTLYIGCGVGLFSLSSTKLYNVIICQYYQAGNKKINGVRLPPYTETSGSPQCPSGYQTDANFTSLCSSPTSAPTPATPFKTDILANPNKNKIDFFDPANYSFLEILILVFIITGIFFCLVACLLICKKRRLKKETKISGLKTEFSKETKKSQVVTEKEEKQFGSTYHPEPVKTTFGVDGIITEKI